MVISGDHERFPAECRLRSRDDFRRVYERRCSAADGRLVVLGLENGQPHSRLGLSVSRKVGNAVVRNRWKRLLRESFRKTRSQLPAGLDLIVIPRAAATPDLSGLMESLPRLVQQVARKLRRA
jgi:ribonuclease P protein component